MKRTMLALFLFSSIYLPPVDCFAASTEVQIMAPLRPKYVAKGYRKIYIADFVVSGERDVDKEIPINVNKEIKETLKSEFVDRSAYEISEIKLEIPADRKVEEVLKDPSFWMAMDIKDRDTS